MTDGSSEAAMGVVDAAFDAPSDTTTFGEASTPDAPAGDDGEASATAPLPDASAPADAPVAAGDDAGGIDTGAPAVRFIARVDFSNPNAPKFAWSGSTILARFTGSSIGVKLGGPTNYYDIRIDGVLHPAPLVTSPGQQNYMIPLASPLAPGPHELSVYRRTEPNWGGSGETTFYGLILDPAGGALLPPSAPSGRRIEIVGDSATTGYGDEGTNANCPFSLATENYDVTYGAVAARAVDADLITIAWSAKGMYRNYGGDTGETMPVLYGRTLPAAATSTWNYSSYVPDAVVIDLGCNDFQQGDPGQPYVTTYTAFVHRLRGYHPNALIICALGPKLSDSFPHANSLTTARGYVQGIVSAFNAAGDARVTYLELPQAPPGAGYGCGAHPSAATHALMGQTLAAELKAKLGW
jgi:lysophospholipase L1-like esterase